MRRLIPESLKARYRLLRAWWLSRDLKPSEPFVLSQEELLASELLSIVVPVHDALEVTTRCLNSLEKFAGKAEVVIVDDGSKLPSVVRLLDDACHRNGWRLIRHEKARGHSRASEQGIAASSRPYVCLLNSDTVVTPFSWAGVIQLMEKDPSIAVAGPSTSHTYGPQQVTRASHCRHYWTEEQIAAFAERYVAEHRDAPPVEMTFVGGFGFFVRRTAWNALNGFDTNLPDYGNETEFCQRVCAAGLRIAWSRAAYIHHLGNESYGKTLGKASILKRSLDARAYIQEKHGGTPKALENQTRV